MRTQSDVTAHRNRRELQRAMNASPAFVDKVRHCISVLGMTNFDCAKHLSKSQNLIGAIRNYYAIGRPDEARVEGDSWLGPVPSAPKWLAGPQGRLAAQLDQLMDREKHLLCPEFSKWLTRCTVLVATLLPLQASAHDWYEGLRSPAGGSCCNGQDCRPVAECITADKREGIELKPGTCSPINYSKVLAMPSPDGKTHACTGPSVHPPGVVARCIILGGSA